eukprot:s2584_g4.t1
MIYGLRRPGLSPGCAGGEDIDVDVRRGTCCEELRGYAAGSLVSAWRRGFGVGAGVWSVRVAEGQNIIPAVTPVGCPPEEFLAQAARELAASGAFAFDPVKRVTFRRRDWP